MTDSIEEAGKLARMLAGAKLPWFYLALSLGESLSTLAVAADSAARTYAAVNGRPGPPRPGRG